MNIQNKSTNLVILVKQFIDKQHIHLSAGEENITIYANYTAIADRVAKIN